MKPTVYNISFFFFLELKLLIALILHENPIAICWILDAGERMPVYYVVYGLRELHVWHVGIAPKSLDALA